MVTKYYVFISNVKVKYVTIIKGNIGNKDSGTTWEVVNIIWRWTCIILKCIL